MPRPMLFQAVLTGVFCVGFSVVVGLLTEALSFGIVLWMSFASGFLGSLFGQTVMRQRRKD